MAGFIYIMSNPAFPNLLKIGKSKKDPTVDRINELNQTGVPEPFKVEYYAFVEDADYLERMIHEELAAQRPNKNREFFSVDCIEAIRTIRNLANQHSSLKYEQIETEEAPLLISNISGLKTTLFKFLYDLNTAYLKKENHFLNQALKVLISLMLLVILLGSVFG